LTISRKNIAVFFKCASPLCAIVLLGWAVLPVHGQDYTAQTASNEVVKARVASAKINAKIANQMRKVASELQHQDFIHESRDICQMLIQSKFVQAADYVILAQTYKTVLVDEDKANRAMQYLKKAEALDPEFGETYTLMARIANEDGRYKEALALSNKALNCKSPDYRALEYKATALANLNRNEEALQTIELAIKHYSWVPELHRIKGSVLENLGRYSQAVDAYRKAWQLHHTDWNVFRIAHCLEMQNKFGEAIEELSQQIKRNPKDGEAFRSRALLKIKAKDLPGAIKDFDTCITLEPTAKTYRDRAKLHQQLGHKDLYKRDLAEAAKMDESPF
jgi:tetratricopeptide (TPR) repeat protein